MGAYGPERFLSPVFTFLNNSVHIHIIYIGSCYYLSVGESTTSSLEGLIATIKCIVYYLASQFEDVRKIVMLLSPKLMTIINSSPCH